jgi:acyl-coenzyme A thioesterase PaaI-like protein
VQAALLDTACGYAAGAVAGNVVTLQLNLHFLSSAKGDRFEARARVTKAG